MKFNKLSDKDFCIYGKILNSQQDDVINAIQPYVIAHGGEVLIKKARYGKNIIFGYEINKFEERKIREIKNELLNLFSGLSAVLKDGSERRPGRSDIFQIISKQILNTDITFQNFNNSTPLIGAEITEEQYNKFAKTIPYRFMPPLKLYMYKDDQYLIGQRLQELEMLDKFENSNLEEIGQYVLSGIKELIISKMNVFEQMKFYYRNKMPKFQCELYYPNNYLRAIW